MAVPVITANAGGMKELVEEGVSGLLFEWANPADLAAKMHTALEQPELLRLMRRNLRKRPIKTLQDNALELAGTYRALLTRMKHQPVEG